MIVIKWEGMTKSKRLAETKKMFMKVEEMIRAILNIKNTPFHRMVFLRLERVNSLMNNIV